MKKVSLKKVAELDKVVQLCGALEVNYTPGNEALTPTALTSLLVVANEKLKAVNSAQVAVATLIKQRSISFRGIPNLAARIVRRVKSSQATVAEKLQAREIHRKYFHHKWRQPEKAVDAQQGDGATPKPKSAGAHYGDFTSQLSGLEQVIHLVSTITSYKSVEPEFQVEGLKKTVAELQALHLSVIAAQMALSEARKAGDEIMNAPGGVATTVSAFKEYLRSKYGFDDLSLKQLSQ